MEVYSCTYTNRKPDIRARHICSTLVCKFQSGMIFEQSVTVDPRLLPEHRQLDGHGLMESSNEPSAGE